VFLWTCVSSELNLVVSLIAVYQGPILSLFFTSKSFHLCCISMLHMFFFQNGTFQHFDILIVYCIIVSLCSFHVLLLCVFIAKFCFQLCYFSAAYRPTFVMYQ